MFRHARSSLLAQLLGVYLLFAVVVIAMDLKINAVAQQQVRTQVQTTDLALAQEIALDTDAELRSARAALVQLSRSPAVRSGDPARMAPTFRAFKAARDDTDLVYWLDAAGRLQVSVPTDIRTLGADFSNQRAFRLARGERGAAQPVLQDGIVDLTTFHAVVTIALPVHRPGGGLLGIVAMNLRLDNLNDAFQPVIAAQKQQHQHLVISIVDAQGRLIGTAQRERLLQPVAQTLPGARQALAGHDAASEGVDSSGEAWLYSAVPIKSVGWAVVVQRSSADAFAVIANFRRWITVAALFFTLGGFLFWLVLLRRVVRPLHLLARRYAGLPAHGGARALKLAGRPDEIGALAGSLARLERDVRAQLAELHTLLETSNAVVNSLDPSAVGRTIIREVQRLVDIQAAAVLVPDETGVLRVLVSEGRAEEHDDSVEIRPDELAFPSALALHDRRPVQMIAGEDEPFPPWSYAAGFRAVLAIPIVSPHAGSVSLVVHRRQPERFTDAEVDLLLTFANYATLAWEHAVLYERSDERLRVVAQENERLYREAAAEKQTLSALIHSVGDGLILTDVSGRILYANAVAGAMCGVAADSLPGAHIDTVHTALRCTALDAAEYDERRKRVATGRARSWLHESDVDGQYRALSLRVFDVRDEESAVIGRGLLLRDITREYEADRFKSSLLSAVGHELRTPLTAIKGYASTLLQEDVDWSPEDERMFLGAISDEADRLAELVSNLLDLSRLEAGLVLLQTVPCALPDLVTRAVDRLSARPSDLSVDIPPDLPPVQVDRARAEMVIHNLLANAQAYGDGRIGISAEQEGEVVAVRVADNGPGMSEEELPHIFERFYRAPHGAERRSEGTGLGLAICKAFVEAHGGTIWAESGEEGTAITFTLPVAHVRPAGERAELVATSGDGT